MGGCESCFDDEPGNYLSLCIDDTQLIIYCDPLSEPVGVSPGFHEDVVTSVPVGGAHVNGGDENPGFVGIGGGAHEEGEPEYVGIQGGGA